MSHQVAIITGGSSGIGKATVSHFSSQGSTVYNLDLQPPEGVVADEGNWIQCDVTDSVAVTAAVSIVMRNETKIDVAIANAGISIRRPFLKMTPEEVERLFAINFLGVVNLWQAAGTHMFEAKSGCLLATASTNGNAGYPFYADYNASKAAVISLCKTVALELAPYVRTACVSPGYVMTPMQRLEYSDEMIEEVNSKIPALRHARPVEVASAFYYLASPQATFITGQQLIMDGGELAGGTASAYRTAALSDD